MTASSWVAACALLAAAAQAQDVRVVAADSAVANQPSGGVSVPAGFKLLSGGVRANWTASGSLLTQSQPAGTGPNAWAASAKDHLVAEPAALTVYAVALGDPRDAWEVIAWQQTSTVDAHPATSVGVAPGYAMTGGGCVVNWKANPALAGNLLTASFPSSPTTWECRSRDHGIASPASITAFVIGIRPKTPGLPLPVVQITSATSSVDARPSAVAPALAGFVVTGGGARALPAQPHGAGQLLTATFPELPAGATTATGWRAASKDHAYASPGTVEAFAINVRFPAGESATPTASLPGGAGVGIGVTLTKPFAMTARAATPFVVDLAWDALPPAVGYEVQRDGVVVAQLPGSARGWRDTTRTPGSRQTYRVLALNATIVRPGGSAPAPESASMEVNTPVIAPPAWLTVTGTSPRSVEVTWQPAAGAANYVINRDGSTRRVGPQPVPGRFVDTNLPLDIATYKMQSLYVRPDGSEVLSDPSPSLTLRLGPFRVLAVGDSIMWGQGLRESSKFTRQVEQWLGTQLGRPVALTVLAHSGAIIGDTCPVPGALTIECNTSAGPASGEVPSDFPVIRRQAMVLGPARAGEVDLLLVDGCANDVNIKTVFDLTQSEQALGDLVTKMCARMQSLLGEVTGSKPYQRAKIVVTGLYPVISASSDLSQVAALAANVGAPLIPAIAPLLPGVPPDPFLGAIAGAITADQAKKRWISRSIILYAVSSAQIQNAVTLADPVGTRIRFASVNFGADNAFAAPDSWLFRIPLGADSYDEAYSERAKACAGIADTVERTKCNLASLGHPNPRGAQAYASAVIGQLTPFLPAWRAAFASTQSAP